MRITRMVAVFSFSFCISGIAPAQEAKPKYEVPYIAVPGDAYAEVRPEFATLQLGVISDKPKAADASAEASRASNDIVAMLVGSEVLREDIRTSNLSLSPTFVEERDPRNQAIVSRKLTGYRASITYTVRIRDVDKAGAIASKVIETGANNFQGLSFDLSNREEVLDGLRAKAVAVALHRAGLYAAGANMKSGRLLALDPQADPRIHGGGEADMPSRRIPEPGRVLAIPVEPGLIRLQASVIGTWELVPK